MDSSVSILHIYDTQTIQCVMMHEDILPTIIDDTWDGAAYQPNTINDIYLGCMAKGEFAGLFKFHWIGGSVLQAHAHILKKYRKDFSEKFAKAAINYILVNIQRCDKLEAKVPTIYPNVSNYLKRIGFVQEGISRKSFKKNGEMHDMLMFGMTKEEMLK